MERSPTRESRYHRASEDKIKAHCNQGRPIHWAKTNLRGHKLKQRRGRHDGKENNQRKGILRKKPPRNVASSQKNPFLGCQRVLLLVLPMKTTSTAANLYSLSITIHEYIPPDLRCRTTEDLDLLCFCEISQRCGEQCSEQNHKT